MFIATDMGHDKGTTSDVSMGLANANDSNNIELSNINILAIINM